jgi:hypothetical protein
MLRQDSEQAREAVRAAGWKLVADPFECEFTLLWMPSATINLGEFDPVLNWLSRWEVAVPFRPYDVLAKDIGSEEERAASLPLLLDMRQQVYDSRVVLIRACPRTRRLIQTWARQEMREGEDADLAFLRAVWRVKPLILALPKTWAEGGPVPSPK